MTDRLDLKAIRRSVSGRRSLPQDHFGALIAEVERLRADVERKDRALRGAGVALADAAWAFDCDDQDDAAHRTHLAAMAIGAALSESEEQAVSRSERGTEGVGLSGETAQQRTSGGDRV